MLQTSSKGLSVLERLNMNCKKWVKSVRRNSRQEFQFHSIHSNSGFETTTFFHRPIGNASHSSLLPYYFSFLLQLFLEEFKYFYSIIQFLYIIFHFDLFLEPLRKLSDPFGPIHSGKKERAREKRTMAPVSDNRI